MLWQVTSALSTGSSTRLSVDIHRKPPFIHRKRFGMTSGEAAHWSIDPSDPLTGSHPLGQPMVSRETSTQAGGFGVRTAAQLADQDRAFADDSTPLARAAEHSVLARTGRRPIPRPPSTRVVVVANQKGGVGKTTSTVNMAAALAQLGQRVLVIDLDPQGNASTALSIDHQRGVPSTYDMLIDGMPLADVTQQSPEGPGLYAVPATIDLAGAEIELVNGSGRETRLRQAIAAHPLVGTVEMVRAHLNPALYVSTILITMYDGRTRLASGVAEEVREHFGRQVLRTSIPRSVRVSEAAAYV